MSEKSPKTMARAPLTQMARVLASLPETEVRNALIAARRAGVPRGTAMERLARRHGWMRVMTSQGRRWMTREEYDAMPHRGYRHATGRRKREARMEVPRARRQAIAAMGAPARTRRADD